MPGTSEATPGATMGGSVQGEAGLAVTHLPTVTSRIGPPLAPVFGS